MISVRRGKRLLHAGVPDLLFHDLRRTAARNLRRIGIGENVIMRIGGWKTRSVFQRYDIVDNRDIADAMKKLEQSEKPKPEQKGHVLVTFDNSADAETALLAKPGKCSEGLQQALEYGAGRGSRTPKTRRSADFESAASASSAIPAL